MTDFPYTRTSRLKELGFETLLQIKRISLAVFGSLLLLSSGMLIIGGAMVYSASSKWPQTTGKLTKFDLHPLAGHSSHVFLHIRFQYRVAGMDYEGKSLSGLTMPGKLLKWRAASLRHRYHEGDRVTVLYSPLDPSRAFLERPNLFWDVLLVPLSVGALACWMLFLLFKTRRRKTPQHVMEQVASRFVDSQTWAPILQSVIERDHIVLYGTTTYSTIGGVFAGWPSCHVALLATPNDFVVVPGPFTRRGLSSSVFTIVLELSLGRFWIPLSHGMFFLYEMWRRRENWRHLSRQHYSQLLAKTDSIHLVSIDEAVIYGYDTAKQRLWYRLPGKLRDEFLCLRNEDQSRANEIMAYIGIMQKSRQPDHAAEAREHG